MVISHTYLSGPQVPFFLTMVLTGHAKKPILNGIRVYCDRQIFPVLTKLKNGRRCVRVVTLHDVV